MKDHVFKMLVDAHFLIARLADPSPWSDGFAYKLLCSGRVGLKLDPS